MRQIPGGNNRYTSIPKPIPKLIPKKTYNEAHQISSNEDNSIELKNMKEKYELLKLQFSKLQNQFKLYKIETMTQINKINYDKNNEISEINKEKEEIKTNSEKIIYELSEKIDKITLLNQSLEDKCINLNNELQKVQTENKNLKKLINNADLEKNQIKSNNDNNNFQSQSNETNKQAPINKQNDVFHYQPPENNQKHENENHQMKDNQNISSILPPCIENKTNENFPIFNPKEKIYYLFFPEKTQPNYNKSFRNDVIYGAYDAVDVQRFHYYPESKKIYTFIGFSSDDVRKNWISNFTTKNISYDKLIYMYPYFKLYHSKTAN